MTCEHDTSTPSLGDQLHDQLWRLHTIEALIRAASAGVEDLEPAQVRMVLHEAAEKCAGVREDLDNLALKSNGSERTEAAHG